MFIELRDREYDKISIRLDSIIAVEEKDDNCVIYTGKNEFYFDSGNYKDIMEKIIKAYNND